ncbi:nitrous oxide reductase accessory protein NosL [Inhella gelatinilytica]|uniref:Nitrous oxide reductase accessory protein NosL n=1 Tax=Inhella gelatinilytica TaxID=2795030 RepID=A0A931IVG3_9BURK|nr:nitrous oxide reductase accessory protein NosL [Inhella gelatinilytica]MBH9552296.1 nitrous oxide reductase accessory protein NosL [Inhella gelatinilytica]
MKISRRHCLACAALPWLTACTRESDKGRQGPQEVNPATACDLDGMLLADYAGPKAQLHYADDPKPVFLCDTVEMVSLLLKPEQVRPLKAAYVQDMGKADWDRPVGHWIDAKTAFFVHGSKRHGSMGPTLATFAEAAAAEGFVKAWGGKILPFSQLTADLADLSGGALHDSRM